MQMLAVISAAALAWILGALWHTALAKAWLKASGVALGADGGPANPSTRPFLIALAALLLASAMPA